MRLICGFPRLRLSLRRLSERQPDQRVELGIRTQLLMRGCDGGACFGGLEAEVAKRGYGVRGRASARGWGAGGSGQARRTELALELVGDARGELGADSVGA